MAVHTVLLLIFSDLGLSVLPSCHLRNLYPGFGTALAQIVDPGVRLLYFFPDISLPLPSSTLPEPKGDTYISKEYPPTCWNCAVYVASACTFESVLVAVVFSSLHLTNLYPVFGVAVELILPPETTLLGPAFVTLPPSPATYVIT